VWSEQGGTETGLERGTHYKEARSVQTSLLSLGVLLLCTAIACTTTSAPQVARNAGPPLQRMDDPEADAALLRGEWEEGARLHRALIQEQPGNGPAFYHLGYALGQLGKFSEEIAAYREAIRLGVREGALYYNLGIALATSLEDYDGAITAFGEGLRMTPDDPELWYNLGVAYLSKRDFARARDAFQVALEHDPEHVEALNNLGHALLGLGDRAGARVAWERILRADPGNVLAERNLRFLEQQDGRGPGTNGRNPGFDEYGVQ